jgi:opacity protein-like surface antigen
VFAYRWSGCHAGANVGFGWSQQQQTLAQSSNAGVAPASQGQQSVASNAAAGGSSQSPPSNNQNGNGGGWWPPYGHPPHGHHGGYGWWDGKQHDHDKYGGDKWSHDDQQHVPGKYASYGWPQSGSHDGRDHDWLGQDRRYGSDKYADYGWPQQGRQYDDHDKSASQVWQQPSNHTFDKDAWQQHDRQYAHDGYHDEHHDRDWGHQWQPHNGWPQNNPPPNKGGGQPPQQNPPPAQGNNGAGAVTQQAAALLQTPISMSSNGGDVIGGVQLGCDYQINRFVVGIQAMADFAKINSFSSIPQAPLLTTSTTANNLYTATVRAGYLVTPATLAYVKGGAAWTQTKVALVNNGNGQSATATFDRTGWTVGAGVEWMFARNWSAFAEYDYADFGRVTGPLTGTAGLAGGPIVVSLKSQVHTGLVGVNYKFDLLALSSR